MQSLPSASWYQALPKVELHLHLEGAIPYDALWQLVRKYDGASLVPGPEALRERFQYRDFPHFLELWRWKNQFIREYGDFTFIAEAVARDLAAQNIRYAEVFYSAPDFFCHGLRTHQMTCAIRDGLDRVPAINVALVADMVRDDGPDAAARTLAEVNEVRECGVIGIGIGGSEHDYPPEPFEAVYAQARKEGFRTSAHAGEAAGPASIWGALRSLQVDRIGHGTRAGEDPRLLDYLIENHIPVEMCPLSNVRTGVVESYEGYPVRRYFDRGVLLCINTDDPKMFNNSLAEEYQMLVEQMAFTPDEIRRLILQGIEMSWMAEQTKREMAERFVQDPAW